MAIKLNMEEKYTGKSSSGEKVSVDTIVSRQERGWAGHFICDNRCRFRRNTLLTYKRKRIVISTVGLMEKLEGEGFDTVGLDRYFETMAFMADNTDKRYYDADVSKQLSFESEWAINETDADDKANKMHEDVVEEFTRRLIAGEKFAY